MPRLLAALLLAEAIHIDHRRGEPRHWLHWTGVALLALDLLIHLVGPVLT